MVATAAPAQQRATRAIDIPEAVMQRRPQQQKAVAAVDAPVNNPIFKVLFTEETEPEQKRAALAKFLTFATTKAETREHMKQRAEMEDWLEAERARMQEELMRLTDTDTFSVLNGVLGDMNNDLLEWEEKIKPLTDILDGIYTLQTKGVAIDAFREIQNDRKNEAEHKAEMEKAEANYSEISQSIVRINEEVAALGEERAFFGFGDVKKSARQAIAVKNTQLDSLTVRLTELETQLNALAPASESQLAEYANEKAQMRNLLDISGPEHSAKQREIVDSALKFVATSRQRIGEVREHFSKMSEQMDHLKDANGKMSAVRAVMGEAMRDARDGTMTLQGTLNPATEESLIAKIAREEKLEAVNEHVKDLDGALRNNTVSMADLETESIQIRTARSEHDQMLDKTRILHTQGIATVAQRLNSVLNAVSMAALNESTTIAGQTLRRMVEGTHEITQKEVVKNALGVRQMDADVRTVLDDLAAIGQTLRSSNEIYREGLKDLRITMDEAATMIKDVKGDIATSAAIHADTPDGKPAPGVNGATPPPNTKSASPFG